MVIGFCDGQMFCFLNRRDDWLIENLIKCLNCGNRFVSLLLSCRHDATSVLSSNVVALTVELRRVMNREEHFKEGLVCDEGWIIINDDYFCVASCPIADFFVCWIKSVSTCVSWQGRLYSFDSLVGSFNTCLLYTSPSPRDAHESRMPSSA